MKQNLSIQELASKMNLGTQTCKKWIKENTSIRFPLDGRRKRFFTPKEVSIILKEYED